MIRLFRAVVAAAFVVALIGNAVAQNGVVVGGGGGAPSGAAGGALAGTYPNPTIAGTVATVAHGIVVQQSTTQVSHTGDTSEFVLATISVPAIPAGASFRLTPMVSYTGTAGTKTSRIYYGAASSGTAGTKYQESINATASLSYKTVLNFWNRTTSSQFGGVNTLAGAGAAITATTTSSVTTTTGTEITLTGQLANSGDTITLEGYTFEVILP